MNAEQEFLQETDTRFERACHSITHCLNQLNDEQLWLRPTPHVNSIGIILQHLRGNLRQWIVSGIGGAEDIRQRAQEFNEGEHFSQMEALTQFTALIAECRTIIQHLTSEELTAPRRIQGVERNVLNAIYGTLTHLNLHVGQILYITHLILGERYILTWTPQAKEQGA